MTDFVLVLATAALLAGPAAKPAGVDAAAPGDLLTPVSTSTGTKSPARTFADAATCEQAVLSHPAPAGRKFICLPHDLGPAADPAH